MDYYIIGPTIINNIYVDGMLTRTKKLGGTIFALQGGLVWNESIGYISNVGKDFNQYYGEWFNHNQVSRNELKYTLPHTQYTRLYHGEDELHEEITIYGVEEEHLVEKLDILTLTDILETISSNKKPSI